MPGATQNHGATLLDQVNHVFLLKRLPNEEESNRPTVESDLLERLSRVAGRVLAPLSALRTVGVIQTWEQLDRKEKNLSDALSALRDSESLCIYVRAQNCTVYFTQVNKDHVRVITFRPSVPNEFITGTRGSLVVTYPETVDIVPKSELLLSKCFSDQLDHLTASMCEMAMPKSDKAGQQFVEVREPSSPCIVSELLVSMLSPVDPLPFGQAGNLEELKIEKKLRDQINWKDCELPFRRSGLWTSAKVVLTLSLKEEMASAEETRLMYKIVVLETLLDIAEEYCNGLTSCQWDTALQMKVKLARRAEKLTLLPKTGNDKLEETRKQTLQAVYSTIDYLNARVSKQWNETVFYTVHGSEVREIEHAKWEKACVHYMESLYAYLTEDRLEGNCSEIQDNLKMIDPVVETETVTLQQLLERHKQGLCIGQEDPHLNMQSTWIYHVEWFVRKKLNEQDPCDKIYQLLQDYFKTVFSLYGSKYADPVCYSRMVITMLKIVSVLDKIAVREHPLLLKYATGIEENMFRNLLIPEKCDMMLVEKLVDYFQTRNESASENDWLKSSDPHGNTFSSKFAEGSIEMQTLKSQIITDMENRISAKQIEVDEARRKCNDLSDQIGRSSHSYKWNSYYQRHECEFSCRLCSLRSSLERERISVSPYQRPLPPKDHLRNAVVFELIIPPKLAILRDSVLLLMTDALGYQKLSPEISSNDIQRMWTSFGGLNEYRKSGQQNLCYLGSQPKDALSTHYTSENPDVTSTWGYDSFILENGLNCVYYRSPAPESLPPSPFTFKIISTKEKERELYEALQVALDVKPPTENMVLASQYSCHKKLTLREFTAFGCLRSANLLQIRNLYREVASRVLSLDKEPVLELIMQTLWELGPGKRENHVDFELSQNQPFVDAFLDTLRAICEENATNWSNPVVFMALIIITLRILVLSESTESKNKGSLLLQRYRQVLEEWSVKLEEIVSKTAIKDETNALMEVQLKCAVSMVLTFNVRAREDMPWIFREPSDVTFYLKGLSRLHYLVVRENILSQNPPSKFLQNVLRHARVNVPLNLQPFLETLLNQPTFNKGLHAFVCVKWFGAKTAVKIPTFYGSNVESKKHAFQASYRTADSSHEACVDILRGTFFVDGYPPSVLPESVVRHELYQTFFRTSQFRVQRDALTFKTVDKYRGLDFQFTLIGSKLIVRQMGEDGQFYELLPRTLFQRKIPKDLINNFTHWYDSKSKNVYFRYPSLVDEEERIEEDTQYLLVQIENGINTCNEWHLVNYKGPNVPFSFNLLSIESRGFLAVTENLRRLEESEYIHVQLSRKDKKVTGKLWRFELSFTVNEDQGLLYCNNYPEFYLPTTISGGQNLDTLVGLRNGLVLEKVSDSEVSGRKKVFLVQHGTVKIRQESGHYHQSVDISVETPGTPVYFVYDVDQVLMRLKPGSSKSAWLYLALLHGSTSSPFPDPFNQLTGTEMAMSILQSAFAWSCSPYDSECRVILDRIAALSPTYKYYPDHLKNMQSIKWPTGLENNSYAAFDGFAMLVRKLLNDSRRLDGLFSQHVWKTTGHIAELCIKSYKRNLNMYNKDAHLQKKFKSFEESSESSDSVLTFLEPGNVNVAELTTLAKVRVSRTPVGTSQTVSSLILTVPTLPHSLEDSLTKEFITKWLSTTLRENWLSLYSLAQRQSSENSSAKHQLTLIYGALLYTGNGHLQQLLNLHNIEVSNGFPSPLQSLTNLPYSPLDGDYRDGVVADKLRESADKPPKEDNYKTYDDFKTALRKHRDQVDSQVASCARSIGNYWPAEQISYSSIQIAICGNNRLNCNSALVTAISNHFLTWFNNRNLQLFIAEVDSFMDQVTRNSTVEPVATERMLPAPHLHFHSINDTVDAWQRRVSFGTGTSGQNLAKQIHSSGRLTHLGKTLIEKRFECQQLIQQFNEAVRTSVIGTPLIVALERAGIYQRLAPIVLLRDFLTTSECVFIGALAVLWANMKRLNRLILYSSDRAKYSVELQREWETEECENWKPTDNPEWLLLELDLDITIRKVQVDVARQMMEMPGERNGVMQLNMGEGKTSVIIPMLVSTLSSGKDILCRVTVLNSIFATNFNLLAVTIGGLVNKRLYTVPCNRDMDIGSSLGQMENVYNECVRLGGAMITLPEYRLSFRLQMYNSFLQGHTLRGLKIYEIESWLRRHARDLVDESDEIFSVKYQLIYTTGKQEKIDGGSLRWTVCQLLLDLVPQVADQLLQKYGSKCVEFSPGEASKNPAQFAHLRFLGEECKKDFMMLMAKGILEGRVNLLHVMLKEEERNLLKEFLVNENISEETHSNFLSFLASSALSEEEQLSLLLVSGYLRRGILFTALKKRWRVEYGVKNAGHGSSKLTAVPFRAKAVAAERTEFGHPDMAIVLTQLSYFYSGLSDEELVECFATLENSTSAPETVYNSWIKKLPPSSIKSETVKTYQGINLQDYQQRREFLFPILRHHTSVINFWLENVAFPKECKQFPGKLVTNAFDLCYDRNEHATTGFSGTNDTSLLLPVQITQQDLSILSETNARMEETLKGSENTYRRSLAMGDGCRTVLTHMTTDGLRVLIDSGALMLELGNAEIAKLWLELDKKLEGVVYFTEKGEMAVKFRSFDGRRKQKKDTLLALSPFKDRLDNCAVYLDDQHTRGTDIKLPTNFKACVTVGSGMRRDKLIQACMRMRKLGKGQSVHFYLSHEVHNKIMPKLSTAKGQISVPDVLDWSKFNSAQFEKDGLVYWATNARNYSKNLAADDLFELSGKVEDDTTLLAQRCEDPDAQKLKKMYGTYHHKILVTEVIPHWFLGVIQNLTLPSSLALPDVVLQNLEQMKLVVMDKCEQHIPDRVYFHSMLEEEQEKELEPEQEQEEEVHRPSQEKPRLPTLHRNVEYTVHTCETVSLCLGITRLFQIFCGTTIEPILQIDGSGDNCFVTEDFINTIEIRRKSDKTNEFLKQIRFVVSFGKNTSSLLVLSQFEANKLVNKIRSGSCAPGTRLHLFSCRWMDGQPLFLNDSRLQLPLGVSLEKKVSEDMAAPLLVAAGNLYFGSSQEEEAFAKFIGLALKPWTREECRAFEEGLISNKGFIYPSSRALRPGCSFQKDPIEMLMGILKMRNEALRDCDHVVSVLTTCTRVFH